jgi:toluene monooxygenase system protein E
MPSEYEIVTHDMNWTTRKGRNAALEANSSAPENLWYLTYRDKSPLSIEDWNTFRDPDQLTYRRYVTMQDEQEDIIASVLDEADEAGLVESFSQGWTDTLATVLAPSRFAGHALQMCSSYLAQIAPSSYIENCAAFGAADALRRVSFVAYRTRELQRAFPGHGFGENERQIWENDPQWQPTRKALELALTTYDWGESFTAVNLVLRPTLDDVLIRQLGEVARRNGDTGTWLALANLTLDVERSARWSAALAKHAISQRSQNAGVLNRWIKRWAPRADAAATGLAELLVASPDNGVDAGEVASAASQARERVLEQAGIVTGAVTH